VSHWSLTPGQDQSLWQVCLTAPWWGCLGLKHWAYLGGYLCISGGVSLFSALSTAFGGNLGSGAPKWNMEVPSKDLWVSRRSCQHPSKAGVHLLFSRLYFSSNHQNKILEGGKSIIGNEVACLWQREQRVGSGKKAQRWESKKRFSSTLVTNHVNTTFRLHSPPKGLDYSYQ
jgi:hypothetical protein